MTSFSIPKIGCLHARRYICNGGIRIVLIVIVAGVEARPALPVVVRLILQVVLCPEVCEGHDDAGPDQENPEHGQWAREGGPTRNHRVSLVERS